MICPTASADVGSWTAFREYAAWVVSDRLGWDVVPPTVLRDGPAGSGMVQLWCEPDAGVDAVDIVPEGAVPEGYLHVLEAVDDRDRPVALVHEDTTALRRMAVFDVVINNTDRKGGHCLRAHGDGRVFGIDHGVSFHAQWKVRTVIWEFGGEPIPPDVCHDLHRLAAQLRSGDVPEHVLDTLDRFELDALRARTEHLLATGELPQADHDYHCYPWPMI